MKKVLVFLLTFLLISGFAVIAFAASPEIVYDASYDDDTNTVTVSIYVKNAVGTESADMNLAYDESMFEFQNAEESKISSEIVIVADKSIEEGLCTCSFFFAESCAESDLDENGDLQLVEFTFKPVGEDFDINDFCLWATSYDIVGGISVLGQIEPQGDTKKQAEHTNSATVPGYTNNGNGGNNGAAANNNVNALGSTSSGGRSSNWYIYVIAGVLVIAAIAGIALIAVKGGHEDDEEEEADIPDKEQSGNEEQQ